MFVIGNFSGCFGLMFINMLVFGKFLIIVLFKFK